MKNIYEESGIVNSENQAIESVKVSFSVLTKENGILTKKISKNGNGLKKDSSDCRLSIGSGYTLTIDFSELPAILTNLKPNQAITAGISEKKSYKILSEKLFDNQPDTITRTKKYFQFAEENALLLFDYDPASGQPVLSVLEVISGIDKLISGFSECAKVITQSTSSNIFDKESGELLSIGKGFHIYCAVKNGRDIKRFSEILYKRAWLKKINLGFILISKAGSLLERVNLFDKAVFSPERLIFEAAPELTADLYQKRPQPEYFHGGPLDTTKLLNLEDKEEKEYARRVKAEKRKAEPEAEIIKSQYVRNKAENYQKIYGLSFTEAEKIIRQACNFDLYSDFILHFEQFGEVTVSDVLSNRDKYDKQELSDPLEPEESNKACFFANNGKPVIHSFLHGGQEFFLHAEVKTPFCFWYETKKKKDGVMFYELNIDEKDMLSFYKERGIGNARLNEKNILFRKTNNIIEEIEINDIRNMMFNEFIPELPQQISEHFDKKQLENMLLRGINVYIQPAKLETLPVYNLNFFKDTLDISRFFFNNGFIEVTERGAAFKPYSEMTGCIWKKHILQHAITLEKSNSDFEQFIKNICTPAKGGPVDKDRYLSARQCIGYLLNSYNNPAYPKAVILSDGSLTDTPEGGTGKGIFYQAISHMRKLKEIDGKTTDFTRAFCLQNIDMDTQLIVFEDVKRGFDFETFFSGITGGYSIEKKFEKQFKFNLADNPKTVITTNYAVRGSGNSHERRKFEFELYPYYSKAYTPEKDFGLLFDTWNKQQWNDFYNFMFDCSKDYHFDGFIRPYSSDTLEMKKLIHSIGSEAVNFFDELPRSEKFITAEQAAALKADLSDKAARSLSNALFGKKLKEYCTVKGLKLEIGNNRISGKMQRWFIIS